jgi:ADP-ribose pyrophosphatase
MVEPSYHTIDVKILEEKACYQGFFTMKKLSLQHKLFNGDWGKPLTRELFERGEAAAVLLFDPKLDVVVLTEQFRIGALNEPSPWIFELVAGMIEPGESPSDVAIRETLEESGAVITQLTPICQYLVSPGGTNEKLHVFMALVDSTNIGGIHGLSTEGEDILVHKISRQQAYEAVTSGAINNAATIIALQWLELNRASVLNTVK